MKGFQQPAGAEEISSTKKKPSPEEDDGSALRDELEFEID